MKDKVTNTSLLKSISTIFIVFIIFVVLSVAKGLQESSVVMNDVIKALPNFLGYLTFNPLISAVLAGLILFLTVGVFRNTSEQIGKISDRIAQLDSKIDDNVSRNSKLIEETVKRETKDVYDKAEFLYDEVHEMEEKHEWLRLYSQEKLFFDVPTAVAIFEDTLCLIDTGKKQFAYVWLFNSIEEDYFGDERTSLDLALLAIIFFEDTGLALKILEKVQQSHFRSSQETLLYFTVVALRSNSIVAHSEIYRTLEALIIPAFPRNLSDFKKRITLTQSERLVRKRIRKNADAYASLAIYFGAIGEIEKLPLLQNFAERENVIFEGVPFAERLFDPNNVHHFKDEDVVNRLSLKINPSILDRRKEFLQALHSDNMKSGYKTALKIMGEVTSRTAYERRDRAFQIWFKTVGSDLLSARE